jgi:hypothetical protein
MAAKIAMMAITTKSSISVKAREQDPSRLLLRCTDIMCLSKRKRLSPKEEQLCVDRQRTGMLIEVPTQKHGSPAIYHTAALEAMIHPTAVRNYSRMDPPVLRQRGRTKRMPPSGVFLFVSSPRRSALAKMQPMAKVGQAATKHDRSRGERTILMEIMASFL